MAKVILIALIVLTAFGIGSCIKFYHDHPCIKIHQEMVHHDMWIENIYIGKQMYPIVHPEYDAMEEI